MYTLAHHGQYEHLGNAWSTMYSMHRNKELKLNKKVHPFEVYVTDPSTASGNDLNYRNQVCSEVGAMTREEALECFKVVIDMHPDIFLKGKAMPYTSADGHMFSSLNKAGELGLRLGKEDREQFLVDHNTELFVTYNIVIKEYVHVPESLLQQPKAFLPYLEKSYQYILSLKPK